MFLSLVLLSCGPTAPPQPIAEVAQALPPDPMGVQIHTLENGLTVYLSENHEDARISVRVVVRAGGARDPADATGMAHYLEHMLANKGTQNLGTLDYQAEVAHLDRIRALFDELGQAETDEAFAEIYARLDAEGLEAQRYVLPNELKQIYGLLGANGLNAFTNQDSTQYVVDVPANALDAWAVLEGDRFSAPVFRAFQTEVETVYEEKNRSLDNPGRALYSARSQLLFGDHPYGRDVLGTIEHLKRPSVSKTEAFYDTWYVPNNMAVVLAGDFDADRALELIRDNLGGLEPGPLPAEDPPPPAALEGEARTEIVHKGDDTVSIAWPSVPFGHPDYEALVLMDMMLANGRTGLLDQLENDQIVRDASSFGSHTRWAGYQEVHGEPREGQTLEEVEALLLERVAMLKAGEFTQEDLDAVLTQFRVGELAGNESNGARVGRMASAFVYGVDWDTYRTGLDRFAQVDRAQVIDAARRYLGEDRVVVVRRQGEPDLPVIKAPPITERPLNTTEHSEFFRRVQSMELPALEPQVFVEGDDFQRYQAPSGKVYAADNPFNDLASVTLRWEVGTKDFPELCSGWSLVKRSGVGEMSLDDIERYIHASGTAFSTSCGRRSTSVSFSGPREALPGLIRLMMDRIQAPALSEAERQAWQEDYLLRRQQDKEQLSARSGALLSYAQRGEESAWLQSLSDEEVRAISTEDYLAAPARLFGIERVNLVVGGGSQDELLALLPAPAAGLEPAPVEPPRRYVVPQVDRILFLDHDSVQASISVYLPDEDYDPSRYPLYATYRSYMGGSAGLVFQEIREARGLAYSASGSYSSGGRLEDQNLAYARATVQADKAVEAVELLVGLTRGIALDPDRFERARGTAEQGNRVLRTNFRGVPSKIHGWDKIGVAPDVRLTWGEAMQTLSPQELQAFVDRWAEQPVTIAILGDRDRLDLDALGAIAPIEELSMDALVSY